MKPPCPPFMVNVIQTLEQQFPDTRMAPHMFLCPVHRLHQLPILRSARHFDDTTYVEQYVPTVRCLDCPDEYLLIPSSNVLGIAEEHFSSSKHIRQVRLRHITETGIFRKSLYRSMDLYPDQRMTMADLATAELNLEQLDGILWYCERTTFIILATKEYPIEVLKFFIDEKLNVLSVDSFGRSALHWACDLGQVHKAELLIRHGLRLHVRDVDYHTPLDLAISDNTPSHPTTTIDPITLIEAEAKAESFYSSTPLVIACRCDRLDVVEKLVESGASVYDGGLSSPLEIAVRWGGARLVEFLLERGADANSVSRMDIVSLEGKNERLYRGNQPLYDAAEEKLSLLKDYGLHRTSGYWFTVRPHQYEHDTDHL